MNQVEGIFNDLRCRCLLLFYNEIRYLAMYLAGYFDNIAV